MFRAVKISYIRFSNDGYMSLYNFFKTIACPTPRGNPVVNYEVRVIMMFQRRFISYNKCSTRGVWGMSTVEEARRV